MEQAVADPGLDDVFIDDWAESEIGALVAVTPVCP
jgi:hypothetical protein